MLPCVEVAQDDACLVLLGYHFAVEIYLIQSVERWGAVHAALSCRRTCNIVRNGIGQTKLDVVEHEHTLAVGDATDGDVFGLLGDVNTVLLPVAVALAAVAGHDEALRLGIGGGVEHLEGFKIVVVVAIGPERDVDVFLEVELRGDDPVVVLHAIGCPVLEAFVAAVGMQ